MFEISSDPLSILLASTGALIWLALLLSKFMAREFRSRGYVPKD